MYDGLTVTRNDAGVAQITLSRPERLNALGVAMVDSLIRAVADVQSASVLIVRGSGRAFSAGADLKERAGMQEPARRAHNRAINAAIDAIAALPMPTIAALNGLALGGGCELALGCDIRIAVDSATIGLTEARIGAIPGAGGTQRLPRLIGIARALDLMFTAEPISAARALDIGLVNHVYSAADFDAAVEKYAALVASRAPSSTVLLKRVVNQGMACSLADGLAVEHEALKSVLGSADYAVGLAAFAEKRAPRFAPRG